MMWYFQVNIKFHQSLENLCCHLLKNIIILVNRKDYKYIWKLSDTYKTLDIIDAYMNDEYIVERIKKVIRRKQ